MTGQEVACFLDDRGRDDAHPANAFDFLIAFGGTGFEHDQVKRVARKSHLGQQLLQARNQGEKRPKFEHAVEENFAFCDAHILQDLLVAQRRSLRRIILSLGVILLDRIVGVADQLIAGFCGFIAFHRTVKKDGRLTGDIEQVGVGNMAISGEINHVRVVLGGTADP